MDLLQLVEAAQNGNDIAFCEVCQRFVGLVKKHANQAHVRGIREEAQAEAWLAVSQAVVSYDAASGVPVAGFIESRVKYAIWNLFKREKRRWQQEVFLGFGGEEHEYDLLAILPDDVDIERMVENKLVGQEIQIALAHLPLKQRLAVSRTVLQGASLTEVSREMGITAQAIYNLRQRGLGRLKILCSGMYISERG